MTSTAWWIIGLLVLGAVALISYFVRLQRESRRIAKTLDHSKMRKWQDEDQV